MLASELQKFSSNNYDYSISKYINICYIETDLFDFSRDPEDFIKKSTGHFYKNVPRLSSESIYSLLLNAAIRCERKDMVQNILSFQYLENILTHVDLTNLSPITTAFAMNNIDIIIMIWEYLSNNKIVKIKDIHTNDKENILILLKYPLNDVHSDPRLNIIDHLNFLYEEESLKEITTMI